MKDQGQYKKRLIILLAVIITTAAIQYICGATIAGIAVYTTYIFPSVQHLRNKVFAHIPMSAGDILYLSLGISLLVLIAKWIFFILNFQKYRQALALSLLRTLIAAACLYLLFFIGWAGNYNKAPLADSWQLDSTTSVEGPTLYSFDSILVDRLNNYAGAYHSLSFEETGKRARSYYHMCTDIPASLDGMGIKPSLYGNLLEYMGVQGYYNPFTGEAQLNANLSDFILPFVICHELAHQAGIAAEDDANLMAYAVGTKANDSSFRYSCYFNLWLYTHSRLKMQDSVLAKSLYKSLNAFSKANLDTLRAINKRYRSKLSRYSNNWYDSYLRFHHIKDGIDSYTDVVQSAYAWERLSAIRKDSLVHIP